MSTVADEVRAMAESMLAVGIHPRSLLGRLIAEEDAMWARAEAARRAGDTAGADAIVSAYNEMQEQRLKDLNAGRPITPPESADDAARNVVQPP